MSIRLIVMFMLSCVLLFACGDDASFVQREKNKKQGGGQDVSRSTDGRNIDEENEEEVELGELVTIDFVQNPSAKVDILWVIDNSNSMQPFQTSLRQNVSAFIERLASAELNFQIGITSTDVCPARQPQALEQKVCPGESGTRSSHRGSLVGDSGRRVLKAGDPSLVERFQRYAKLGVSGSSFEHGMTAVKLAVEKSASGQNDDFVRSDAFLGVIIVSDEQDDGVGLSMPNERGVNYWERGDTRYSFGASDLFNFLSEKKSDAGFSVSSIVGTRQQNGELCPDASEEGTEYLKLTQQTGGLNASICEKKWNETLANLGDDLNSQISSIKLKHRPVVETIAVEVDHEKSLDWFYVEQKNLVQFVTGKLPKPGSHIKLTYEKAR